MRSVGWPIRIGLFVLALAACAPAPSVPAPTQAPLFRPIAASTATLTPAPLPTLTPALAATPAGPVSCFNDARFVEDLTIPDGTVVSPGEELDKRWSVLNAGTCDWSSAYRLVRVGSSAIEGSDELALFPARAGATGEWQVLIRAPSEPGEYLARWRARAPDGSLFGEEVFLLIFVEEERPSATASPSPTP